MPGYCDRRIVRGTISRIRSAALPLALILLSLWLLVGCFYLPTREHVHLSGSKQDFRTLAGIDPANTPGATAGFTRRRIEAILGRPPFQSDNENRVMYVIHVQSGAWVVPLCFHASPGRDEAIGLALRYDALGTLLDWRQFHASEYYNPIWWGGVTPTLIAESRVLDMANEIPSTTAPAATRPYALTPRTYSDADAWKLKPTKWARPKLFSDKPPGSLLRRAYRGSR